MCKKDVGIVMSKFAALRRAVFPLSTKNLGGGGYSPPPTGARVKNWVQESDACRPCLALKSAEDDSITIDVRKST